MMVFFFLLFVVAIALLLQYLTGEHSLDGLTEDHYPSVRAQEPGEPFFIVIRLENHSRRYLPFVRYREFLPHGIDVLQEKGVSENYQHGVTVSGTTWFRPHQAVEKSIPVSIPRRGRYRLGELVLNGGDFLGLQESRRSYSAVREIVVYPKAAPPLPIGHVLGGFLGDVSASRFLYEDPVLTLGYREYSGREPMKSISWKQSAKTGSLMVKKYDYTLEPSVSVLLNVETAAEDREELIERCYSIARTVCASLEDRGIQYDFFMNAVVFGGSAASCYISEGLGPRHFYGILEQMGKAGYDCFFPSDVMLDRVMRHTSGGHGIVYITPGADPAEEREAGRMAESIGVRLLPIRAREVTAC